MVVTDPEVVGGQRAIILDFGVAKLSAEHKHPETVEQHTDVRITVGTAKYMSPEQAALERTLSDRTDVYSLGIMLYEMLSGSPPFAAKSYALLLDMHRFSNPIPIDRLDPSLDARLVELIGRMLSKRPVERPSMEEVAATLEDVLATPTLRMSDGQKAADNHTPPPLPRSARSTEPLPQVADTELARAASALLSDVETHPLMKAMQLEATKPLHSPNRPTLPTVSQTDPTAPPQLRSPALMPWQWSWRGPWHFTQALTLLLAIVAVTLVVVAALR